MVSLQTPICDFGWKAVDFDLPGVDGLRYRIAGVLGQKGLLVMFICNHCPYVKAVRERIVRDCLELKVHGVGSIAIMSNDPVSSASTPTWSCSIAAGSTPRARRRRRPTCGATCSRRWCRSRAPAGARSSRSPASGARSSGGALPPDVLVPGCCLGKKHEVGA